MDRRRFLLGAASGVALAGGLAPARTAPLARAAASAAIVLPDKVSAAGMGLPGEASYVLTNAYDTGVNPRAGGGAYRQASEAEVAGHGEAAWFRSADGRYFLLAERSPSPLQFGARGDGKADDSAAVRAARDYCVRMSVPMRIDGYFAHTGTLELNHSITLEGIGRDLCGLYLSIDRQNEGVHVRASNCLLTGFEIRAFSANTIQNGQGSYATCITVDELFHAVRRDPAGKLIEPAPLVGTIIRDMKLTRANGSGGGHAIAVVARAQNGRIENVEFIGHSSKHRHGTAILFHWGTVGEDFTLDGSGTVIRPFVLRKEPDAPTYHPHDWIVSGIKARHTGRLAAISAGYNIRISDFDFDGSNSKGDGAQLLGLVVGDEGQRYACDDDAGKVYSGITLSDGTAYDINGLGIHARAVIACAGFGTSKYEDDPTTGARYKEQPLWKNVEISGILLEANISDTTELISVRNFLGNITFTDVHAIGQVSQGGASMRQCTGALRFESCTINGRILVENCDGVAMRDCRLVGPRFPLLALTVDTSQGFALGENVTGSRTGVVGAIEAIPNGTAVQVRLADGWTPFAAGEQLVGSAKADIRDIATVSDATLLIEGEVATAVLASDLAPGDEVIRLGGAATGRGFADAVGIEDKFNYDGGVLYATRYAPADATQIDVTPAPAPLKSGGALSLERRSRNLAFENCDISGSSRVVDARDCQDVAFTGCRFRGGGQYGLIAGEGAEVSVTGGAFSNNGLRRLLPADGELPTRDIGVGPGAIFSGRAIRFEDSAYVVNNVTVNPGAIAASLEDSLFAGVPITANVSAPDRLANGQAFVAVNNKKIAGR